METVQMESKTKALIKEAERVWNDTHPANQLSPELICHFHQYLLWAFVVGVDNAVEKIEQELTYVTEYPEKGNISVRKIKSIIVSL